MFAVLMLSAAIVVAPMTANAAVASIGTDAADGGAWKGTSGAYWYENADGSYLKDGVFNIGETKYLFDASGYTKTGWYADKDDAGNVINWYYFDADAGMKTGWLQEGEDWYYLNEDGTMETYEAEVNGKTYYFESNGKMQSDCLRYVYDSEAGTSKEVILGSDGAIVTTPGWHFVKEAGWYYLDENGDIVEDDWVKSGNSWYYLGTGGRMLTQQWINDDNPETADVVEKYYVGADGAMVTGWYNTNPMNALSGDWVCTDASGLPKDGWVQSGSNWYYINDGRMVSDGYVIWGEKADGTKGYSYSGYYNHNKTDQQYGYYLAEDGRMVTGWHQFVYTNDLGDIEHGTWFHANSSGELTDGWLKDGGEWYYFNNGRMSYATTICDIEDVNDTPVHEEYFDENGFIKAGKSYSDYYKALEKYQLAHTYVLKANGALSKGGWSKFVSSYGTSWYYANSDGTAYDGWLREGNKWYYISHGMMLRNSITRDGYFVDANGLLK